MNERVNDVLIALKNLKSPEEIEMLQEALSSVNVKLSYSEKENGGEALNARYFYKMILNWSLKEESLSRLSYEQAEAISRNLAHWYSRIETGK